MQEEDYFTLMVIRHRFGMISSQVAQILITTKQLTIQQIVRQSQIDIESVIESLTALLQHDLVAVEIPFDPTRPPKGTVRGKKKEQTSIHNIDYDGYEYDHNHAPEVSRSVGEFGDIHSRLLGNFAAGYVPAAPRHSNAVYQSIVPTQRMQYDGQYGIPPTVENYLYSLNIGMVRGLARSHFYSTLVYNLTQNIEAAEIVNQFSFRGKMTLTKVIESTVETIFAKEDNILRIGEKVAGFDPEYSVELFNAMDIKQLQSCSVYSFQRARLLAERQIKIKENALCSSVLPLQDRSNQPFIGGILREILEYMDEIELKRYETIIPRVLEGLKAVDSFWLLSESPGFVDQQVFQTHPLVSNPPIVATSQALQGKLDSSSPSLQNNNENDEDDFDGKIDTKKRKLIRTALKQSPAPGLNTPLSFSINAPRHNTAIKTTRVAEEDDLFDPDPAPGANKRSRWANSNSSSTTTTSNVPLLSILSYQSPLSPDRRVFILNHDRFTLFYRGEMISDYVLKHHGPLASIIIHSINNSSLRFENPQELCEYTVAMIQEAIDFTIPTLIAGMPQNVQERIRSTPAPEPRGRDFDSRISAIHYCFQTPVQPEAINLALKSLIREHYDNVNESKAIQFVVKKQPTSYTLSYHRSKFPPTSKYAGHIEELCFVLHYHRFMQCIRRDYLAQQVQTQFGTAGRLVFLTLVDNLRMEEKTIYETALTTRRECKEILSNLHVQGFVELLEIPVTSERSQIPRSFFVWSVDYTFAGNRMLARFFKSYANLLCRLDFERESQTQIIDKASLQQHMEVTDDEKAIAAKYDQLFSKVHTVLYATFKAMIAFKDLCPR